MVAEKDTQKQKLIIGLLFVVLGAICIWLSILYPKSYDKNVTEKATELFGNFLSIEQMVLFPIAYAVIFYYASTLLFKARLISAKKEFGDNKILDEDFSSSLTYKFHYAIHLALALSSMVSLFYVAILLRFLYTSAESLGSTFSTQSIFIVNQHYDLIHYSILFSIFLFVAKFFIQCTLSNKEVVRLNHNDYSFLVMIALTMVFLSVDHLYTDEKMKLYEFVLITLLIIFPLVIYQIINLSNNKGDRKHALFTSAILITIAIFMAYNNPISSASNDSLFGKQEVIISGNAISLSATTEKEVQLANIAIYGAGEIPKLYNADKFIKDLLNLGKELPHKAKAMNIETATQIQLNYLKGYQEKKESLEAAIQDKNINKYLGNGIASVIIHKIFYDAAPYDTQKPVLDLILAKQYQKAVDTYINDFVNNPDLEMEKERVLSLIISAIIESELAMLDESKIKNEENLATFEKALWSIGGRKNKPEHLTKNDAMSLHDLFVKARKQ